MSYCIHLLRRCLTCRLKGRGGPARLGFSTFVLGTTKLGPVGFFALPVLSHGHLEPLPFARRRASL